MRAKHSSLGLRLGGARRREVVVRRRPSPIVVGLRPHGACNTRQRLLLGEHVRGVREFRLVHGGERFRDRVGHTHGGSPHTDDVPVVAHAALAEDGYVGDLEWPTYRALWRALRSRDAGDSADLTAT